MARAGQSATSLCHYIRLYTFLLYQRVYLFMYYKKFPLSFSLPAELEAMFSSTLRSCLNDIMPTFVNTSILWITAAC